MLGPSRFHPRGATGLACQQGFDSPHICRSPPFRFRTTFETADRHWRIGRQVKIVAPVRNEDSRDHGNTQNRTNFRLGLVPVYE